MMQEVPDSFQAKFFLVLDLIEIIIQLSYLKFGNNLKVKGAFSDEKINYTQFRIAEIV